MTKERRELWIELAVFLSFAWLPLFASSIEDFLFRRGLSALRLGDGIGTSIDVPEPNLERKQQERARREDNDR